MPQILAKEKLAYFKKTFQYLRRYRALALSVAVFSFLTSLFEGFGLGTLIPVFQFFNSDDAPLAMPFGQEFFSRMPWQSERELLLALFGFIFVMIICKNIFLYANNITINKITNWIKRDLQSDLFHKIADADLALYAGLRSGHVIGSISVYVQGVAAFIFAFLHIFVIAIRLGVYLFLLVLISWKLTLAAAAAGLLLYPFLWFILLRIRRIGLLAARQISTLHVRMSETFSGLPVMKMLGAEQYEKEAFDAAAGNLAQTQYRAAKYSNVTKPAAEAAVMAIVLGFLAYAVGFTNINVAGNVGFIITFLYVFLRFFQQTNEAAGLLSGMYANIEQFKAYESLLAEAEIGRMQNGSRVLSGLERDIKFDHVTFSYGERQPVLLEASFTIKKGEFTAFVGATGAGKTTVAHLIAGLYLPTRGRVLIDGVPTGEIDAHAWRKTIGYVAQDVMIFNDSVKNNIRYGSFQSSDLDVERAARVANIHDFIMSLPNGYDTVIGERGAKFSGGQRQRLSIARAVIRNPEIFILDEATSALDTETENALQEEMNKISRGKTVIAIAHRLSTIQRADTILVLHDGQVAEAGSHEELMRQNGLYRHYYYASLK